VVLGVFGIGRGLEAALVGPNVEVATAYMTRRPNLRKRGPPPITRCFSSVRGDKRKYSAASSLVR